MKILKNIILSFLLSMYFCMNVLATPTLSLGAAVGGPSTPSVEIPLIFTNDASNAAVLEFDISFNQTQALPVSITNLPILDGYDIDFELTGVGNTARIIIIPPSGNTPIPTGVIANIRFDLPMGNVSGSQILTTSLSESFSNLAMSVTGFNIIHGIIVDANDSTTDTDGDGITDLFETSNGLHPLDVADASLDMDGDGLTNLAEFQLGTDLSNTDTDGDGINDYIETTVAGLDPTIDDSSIDTDGDGLSNLLEYQFNTNILVSDGTTIPTGTELSGQIIVDTILLSDGVYSVTSDLDITSAVSLTIAPGATLIFTNNTGLTINGSLNVFGQNSSMVNFTGESTWKGSWKGIVVNSGTANVTYANIEWAVDGIYFNGASGSIISSNIINSSGKGIFIKDSSPLVRNNTIQFNNYYGIWIQGVSTSVVEFNKMTDSFYGVFLQGSYVAGASPMPDVTGNSIFNNTYYDFFAASYYDATNVDINVTNNWWGTADFPQIVDNIFDHLDHNQAPNVNVVPFLSSENGTSMYVNQLSGDWTGIPLTIDTTYEVMDSFSVPVGESLAVPEGVKLRFYGANTVFRVEGTLLVNGTATNPVIFTTGKLLPSGPGWKGIVITSSSSNVIIDHGVIEWAYTGVMFDNADGEIKNSILRNNFSSGIYVYQNSSPTISPGNIITSNYFGINIFGLRQAGLDPDPLITNNSIYNNTVYNLYTFMYFDPGNTVVNMPNNWWGTTDLAVIAAKIFDNAENATYSPIVDVQPVLITAPAP